MLCDTRKGVVYGTRLPESGFAIANPYLSQVLRLFFGTPTEKRTGFFTFLPIFTGVRDGISMKLLSEIYHICDIQSPGYLLRYNSGGLKQPFDEQYKNHHRRCAQPG
jgi:hypothetical protein